MRRALSRGAVAIVVAFAIVATPAFVGAAPPATKPAGASGAKGLAETLTGGARYYNSQAQHDNAGPLTLRRIGRK